MSPVQSTIETTINTKPTSALVLDTFAMSQPGVPTTKTIKLVVPPQYHSLGYQDYTSTLSLSETPSVLKRAGSQNGLQEGMTLLFRGRRITPEEEHISFQDLMKKVVFIYLRD